MSKDQAATAVDEVKTAQIEALAEKPVDEIAAAVAESAPAQPQARTTAEIVDSAAEKGEAEYQAKLAEILDKAKKTQEKLHEEGLERIEASKRTLNPPTPLDQLGEPMEMADATAVKAAQIVWKLALKSGVESKGLKAISDKLGATSKDVLPLTVGNVSLSADMSQVVLDTYPELYARVQKLAEIESGQDLMVKAGYDAETIKKVPKDVLDHWAMSQVHDHYFESDSPSLVDRLKSHKATIAEALGNENVQRSMKWAGMLVGCATGGIVASAGVKGVAFLASKLAENPSVQKMAKTLEDRSISFVSKTFNIGEKKVREKVDHAKGVAEKVGNSKWAKLGKVAAMVGIGVALGNLDFVKDAATVVAEHSVNAFHGSVEALSQAGHVVSSTAADVAHTVGSHTAEGLRTVADYVDPSSFDADQGLAALDNTDTITGAAGQYSPDATGGASVSAPAGAGTTSVEVKHGDSLWRIAERHLEAGGVQASNTEIQNLVNHMYEVNKEVIGNNPNLIFEHQNLVIDVPVKGASLDAALGHVTPDHTDVVKAVSQVTPEPIDPAVKLIDSGALPSKTDPDAMQLYLRGEASKIRVVDETPSIG